LSTGSDGAPQLEFTWDPAKAASNLSKHGVSLAQAASVLLDALALTVFDAGHSEFEERVVHAGNLQRGPAAGGVAHLNGNGARHRQGADHCNARGHPQRAPAVRE